MSLAELQVSEAVGVGLEDDPAGIAALRDVMGRPVATTRGNRAIMQRCRPMARILRNVPSVPRFPVPRFPQRLL